MSTEPAPHIPAIPPPRFFFAVSLSAALFFVVWSWLVFNLPAIHGVCDQTCADYWHEWTQRHRGLTDLMIFLTEMGGIAAMMLVAIMGAIWQSALNHRVLAVAWLGVVIGGGLLNLSVKSVFDQDRPPVEKRDPVVHEENSSYPSGHSMGSAIGYGMLGYALILPQRRRPRRVAAILLMTGIVLAVGFSRIFLRAHWVSDVIGGWTIGLCWLFFCLGWLERYRLATLRSSVISDASSKRR